jgi:glycosyltransferase involved in cell wall biosynthesis
MRVALISFNAQARNAIGNQVVEKLAFFLERGAEIRVFLQSLDCLHSDLRPFAQQVGEVGPRGPVWDWLADADLVIAEYARSYDLLHFLPLLVGKKPRLVLDYHGVTPARHWTGPQRDMQEQSARNRGIVWCADVALAHSQFAKKELHRATGFPVERILVEPCPTDTALFQPGESNALRSRPGLGNQPILLYVGRLAASKRVPILIEALPLLPDVHAAIVGDDADVYGAEAERCKELAKRLGVADRLHFLGQVDDRGLAELYRGADVFVIPSLHEGYCLPAVEAMASGLPVVAARTSALPETIGDAGLTFTPDDADDLARQVSKVLRSMRGPKTPSAIEPKSTRVAIAAFRFGSGIIGGAETSLRTIAAELQQAGQHVEIFTTCTSHESDWTNDLPVGTLTLDSLRVHRFPIDPHERAAHHETIRKILDANGQVDGTTEQDYLRHSIHSTKLVEVLRQRRAEFDAIIVGPYLFGLTHDITREFAEQTLLLPCFHEEPFARLRCWQQAYAAVGGVLYHSPEEQEFAQTELGLNHPRGIEIGTMIDVEQRSRIADRGIAERFVLYCGRYSRQKNVPLLLEYAERYQRERPGRFQFVFAGQGEVPIPHTTWAIDRGRVTEEGKRNLLASADAVAQLSTQESLSLVALEAWALGTPVIAHGNCAVLRGQIARSDGGRIVSDYEGFAAALDDLWERPDAWRALGDNGRQYVAARYGSTAMFRRRLLDAVASLRVPLAQQMRQRGLARAAQRSRPAWRERFGQIVEEVLDREPAPRRWDVDVQPLAQQCRATAGSRSALLPVRVANHGTLPALPDGPAATVLVAEVIEQASGKLLGALSRSDLPALLAPGQSLPAGLAVALPATAGQYNIVLRAQCPLAAEQRVRQNLVPLVAAGPTIIGSTGPFLETVQSALGEAHRLQRLPDDYLDVTEGRFARWKRWLKQKLLGNFKKAYVDVLSRQQSQVNQQLVTAVQQLAEYCAALEHAVHGLQTRLEKTNSAPSRQDDESPTESTHTAIRERTLKEQP